MLSFALLYFGIGNILEISIVPIGHLYLFIDYMIRFFTQMNRAMQHLGNLERARGAADHIFELLDREALSDTGEIIEHVTEMCRSSMSPLLTNKMRSSSAMSVSMSHKASPQPLSDRQAQANRL